MMILKRASHVSLMCLCLWFMGCATAIVEDAPRDTRKIIAVGDIHGDYAAYMKILQAAEIVDTDGNWAGGETVFVQTGDIADRGPDTRKIIEHIRRLQKQAVPAGGQVVPLIGNHEAMVMTGDLRYVHPDDFKAFAPGDEVSRTPFIKAWNPKGDIGKWVAGNDAIAMIDGTIFVHGGISREYSDRSLDKMNRQVRAAIKTGDNNDNSIIHDPLGPLWYRGLIGFSKAAGSREHTLDARQETEWVLKAYEADRIVVGHTPKLSGIKASHDGKLIRIDTGASSYYGGTRSYLRIENGSVFAHDNGKVQKLD